MKTLRLMRVLISGAILAMSSPLTATEASAPEWEEPATETDDFRIGDSCAALAYLTYAQMREIATVSSGSELNTFCYPEEPSDCSEYASLVSGIGKLTTNESGYYCRLTVPTK